MTALARPASVLLAWALVLVGCGPGDVAEPLRQQPELVEPLVVEDPDAARKRECVVALTRATDPRVHTLMRSLCAEWVELDVPGIAVAIAEPGKPTIHAELGVRCFGQPDEVTATTVFRIGSVSKPITAALALGLVADGVLALDQDASTVPGFRSQSGLAAPRLDALLRHRSGLGEIVPATLVEFDGAWLTALGHSPPSGPPGEWHYSNAGYSLVGAVLEHASGQRYATLLEHRIAAPLGLSRLTTDVTLTDAACGHFPNDVDLHPVAIRDDLAFMPGDPTWMTPAGGILSSATELAELALALGTDVLPGSGAMFEPGAVLPSDVARAGHPDERYGLGLRSWQLDASGERAYGHTGNNTTFSAELLLAPNRRAIVILANRGVTLPATVAAAESLITHPD